MLLIGARAQRPGLRAAGPLLVALTALLGACGPDCPLVRQEIVVASPDQATQDLIAACAQPPDQSCESAATQGTRPISGEVRIQCGCLPLCEHLLEITDQFDGPKSITQCFQSWKTYPTSAILGSPGPGQLTTARSVFAMMVEYRPSSCR